MSTGIKVTNGKDVTIIGNKIEGFETGIDLNNVTEATLNNNTIKARISDVELLKQFITGKNFEKSKEQDELLEAISSYSKSDSGQEPEKDHKLAILKSKFKVFWNLYGNSALQISAKVAPIISLFQN